ncbi:MFS transporter [Actinoplanes sp. OR16]|uniref:MFS transporter n=1 Tax=Actinoplanes sp. OR16 TaxID=946334 RepID=UPI000F700C0F|nr:MFS transporter [Actinoplanes sp. OR16]BBH68559.1 MFS transporter [Actinoplanes sp. OR16]
MTTTETLRTRLLLPAMVLTAFGLYFASLTPQIVTLSIRIAGVAPENKTVALSTVILIGALLSIATLPLFGALSDRTRGRYGRRRPWLVGGAALALLGLVVAGSVPSVAGVAAGWALGSLGTGAAFAGFLPLIPEFVPDRLRARLSGLIGFVVSLSVLSGVLLGSALVDRPLPMLAIPGVVALGATVVLAYVIRHADQAVPGAFPRYRFRDFLDSYWLRTGGDRDFAWNWVSRLLLGLAYVGVQTYATYYLTDTAGLTIDDAAAEYARFTAISTPIGVVCFLLSGYLSDRLGRRRAFVVVGAAVLATGLVVAAVTQSLTGFLIGWLILSVGQAVYLTVDIAIAAEVVPDPSNAGKAMSVYQVATLLPNVGAPVVAVAVLAVGGYPAFFIVLAVIAVLSAVAVTFVRRIS